MNINGYKNTVLNLSKIDNIHVNNQLDLNLNNVDDKNLNTNIIKVIKKLCKKFAQFRFELSNDRDFVSAALKLEHNLKSNLIKGIKGKAIQDPKSRDIVHFYLRQFRRSIMQHYFAKTIDFQISQISLMQACLNDNPSQISEKNFVNQTLKEWLFSLAKGKPIVIPSRYHCTPTIAKAKSIADSSIKVCHESQYEGAWLSTTPLSMYGNKCFCIGKNVEFLSDIDQKETQNFEKCSHLFSRHCFKSELDAAKDVMQRTPEGQIKWFDKTRGNCLCLGFPVDIPILRPKKIDGPLDYYEKNYLAFLAVKRPWIDAYFIPNVKIISLEQMRGLHDLYNATFPITINNKLINKIHIF